MVKSVTVEDRYRTHDPLILISFTTWIFFLLPVDTQMFQPDSIKYIQIYILQLTCYDLY